MPRRSLRAAGAGAAVTLLVVAFAGDAALAMQEAKGGVKLGDAVTNAGLTLRPPRGWTVEPVPSPPALVLAEQAADVGVESPGGPRLTTEPVTTAPVSSEEMIAGLDEAPLVGRVKVFKTKIGGERAAGIEFTTNDGGTTLTTRFITVPFGDGRAYTFLFEAPRKQFKRAKATLDAVLATVQFDVASVPAP